MSRVDTMISRATIAAQLSFGVKRTRVGAVVAKGSRVLSAAANTSKNLPNNLSSDVLSQHAEWNALKMCNPEGADIYIVRLLADGTLGMAAPCYHCSAQIQGAGIRRIVYSDWNGQIVESRYV